MPRTPDRLLDAIAEGVRLTASFRETGDKAAEQRGSVLLYSGVARLLGVLLRSRKEWERRWWVDDIDPEENSMPSPHEVKIGGSAYWSEGCGFWSDPFLAHLTLSSDLQAIDSFRLLFGDRKHGLRRAKHGTRPTDRSWRTTTNWTFDFSIRHLHNVSRMNPFGVDPATQRELYVVFVDSVNHLAKALEPLHGPLTCLVVWDAGGESTNTIGVLAQALLEAGAVYVCCWGTNCERVHDIIDETHVWRTIDDASASQIVTTWDADESLEEAITFVMDALPENEAAKKGPVVAVCVGRSGYTPQVRKAFADPVGFRRDRSKNYRPTSSASRITRPQFLRCRSPMPPSRPSTSRPACLAGLRRPTRRQSC
jgi:hypothetical protein